MTKIGAATKYHDLIRQQGKLKVNLCRQTYSLNKCISCGLFWIQRSHSLYTSLAITNKNKWKAVVEKVHICTPSFGHKWPLEHHRPFLHQQTSSIHKLDDPNDTVAITACCSLCRFVHCRLFHPFKPGPIGWSGNFGSYATRGRSEH